ncbi:DHA2 family efflux MFS transporter permease subunit [Brevibacillus fluminis]|uniref:DHA2 family efflux MFS transporter permease subunit n=1 Tax=Brevibacillus fluminis TaxID=511487 RepID=A0A3M8DJF7_9BACL|nr:DHA2 family efflux MFS transporter permease subunit [Brevibacillus fluminis]RNB87257.1 DHA2 family efflux MFS transporter permease subunit [Brevibacillus fluminis]
MMKTMKSSKWSVLFVVTLVSFITNLDATIVVTGLPPLMKDLSLSIETGMWTITSFYITSTVFLLPSGRWSDMLGTKRVFLWGFALFTLATALCGTAGSGAALIGDRLLQGTGAAMAMAASTPILIRTFPPNELGVALGINNIAWVTGSLIGPVLGGALIGEFGWRSMFYAVVPIGVIGLAAGIFFLRDTLADEKAKTDWPGMLTFGPGLTALLIALSEGQAWGWASGRTLGLFATAIFLWIAFVFIEMKARHPLFHLSLLAYRNYSIGLGITMSYCIGYFAVTILLTLYLQGAQNLSPLESGLMLIPLSVPQLFTAPFGGRLADRFGPARMILLGSFLIGFALLMLGQLGHQLSNMAVIIPLMIISAATGLSWPSLAKAVLSAAPQEQAGSASGMFWTVYNMGRAISQALALAVVQLVAKSEVASKLLSGAGVEDLSQSKDTLIYASNIGFRFFAVFLAIAVLLGLLLLRPQMRTEFESRS